MAESFWHRWQLTAPLAALSRPVCTPGAADTGAPGPAAAAGTAGAAIAHGLAAPAGTSGPVAAPGPAAAAGTPGPTHDASTAPGPSAATGAGAAASDAPATARPGVPLDGGLPVLLGGARARQVDGTTCGSAVLVMLAATGDPALAEWLETGRLPEGTRPPEVPAVAVGDDERFAAAQREVKRATGRRALGPLPWPAALGTPPWTAARTARFPGLRYRARPLDDGAAEAPTILGLVEAANRRGQSVPLYVGGDLRGGVAHAVPRHVVLAVPPPPGAALAGTLHLYEPSQGSVHSVRTADLLHRTTPHPALGGWTHVMVVLLPVPA